MEFIKTIVVQLYILKFFLIHYMRQYEHSIILNNLQYLVIACYSILQNDTSSTSWSEPWNVTLCKNGYKTSRGV